MRLRARLIRAGAGVMGRNLGRAALEAMAVSLLGKPVMVPFLNGQETSVGVVAEADMEGDALVCEADVDFEARPERPIYAAPTIAMELDQWGEPSYRVLNVGLVLWHADPYVSPVVWLDEADS